jgi:hypothetical protein
MGKKAENWFVLGSLSVGCVYFYVFMEWIFFVTKPSFFSVASAGDKMLSLAITPLFPLLPGITAIALVGVLSCFVKPRAGKGLFFTLACLIPAGVLSATVFLLIDNFTYTLFGIGVVSSESPWHLGYAALLILLMTVFTRLFFTVTRAPRPPALFRGLITAGISLIILSSVAAAGVYATGGVNNQSSQHAPSQTRHPNVLILSSDGLNAEHLSAYGYERDTTPFLRDFMKGALLFENCFTNCAHSGGSLASLFTGRLPTTTKVVYPPDILRGIDAYRHLPGILGNLGYHRFDISERHYADPYDLNMRNAFDIANFRTERDTAAAILPRTLARSFNLEQYFLSQMLDRIGSRLLHAFGLKRMVNIFEGVTKKGWALANDEEKVKAALAFIDKEGEPFLVHLHLMGTHGWHFTSKKPLFSAGKAQVEGWMDDFYDDAILDFDGYVKDIVRYLDEKGILDDTIVVIHTDHGPRWSTHERLPLIIRFPRGEHAGRISYNVQYIDLAPTILDYMGLEIPPWMEGSSLLRGNINPKRPIFAVSVKGHKVNNEGFDAKPASLSPLEGLGTISAIICQRFFLMNLHEPWPYPVSWSNIKGHTAPCDEKEIPSEAQLKGLLVEHLREKGFDLPR